MSGTGRKGCCGANSSDPTFVSVSNTGQSYFSGEQTPTITAGGAYAAEEVVGGLLQFTPGGDSNILNGLTLIDDDSEMASLKLFIFDEQPSAIADNAAFAPTRADLDKLIATIYIPTFNYETLPNIAAAYVPDINQVVPSTFWAYLVTDGSTPTYTATTDLTLKLTFEVYA